MSDINEDGRIPITLLTGFLGAGKTTMLNRLLSDPDSGQIAVIVNEFGEIGIDGDLIVRRDEEMMELSNGCICCEGKDDLVGALYSLYKKRLGLEKPKISFMQGAGRMDTGSTAAPCIFPPPRRSSRLAIFHLFAYGPRMGKQGKS